MLTKSSNTTCTSIVLTRLESAGKSAFFRGLTGQIIGDESNFRGSTVMCRKCRLVDCECEVVDTPGNETAGYALRATVPVVPAKVFGRLNLDGASGFPVSVNASAEAHRTPRTPEMEDDNPSLLPG